MEKVEGYVGNFTVTVRKKARYVNERPLHRLRHLHREVPEDSGRRRVTKRASATARRSTRPSPRRCPTIPVIDTRELHLLPKGHLQGLREVLPDRARSTSTRRTSSSPSQVGNIVLATGYDMFDARRIPQYGYGRLPNVFTSLEFERMCNAAGPTGGNVVLRDGKTHRRRSASSTASAAATATTTTTAPRSAACRA